MLRARALAAALALATLAALPACDRAPDDAVGRFGLPTGGDATAVVTADAAGTVVRDAFAKRRAVLTSATDLTAAGTALRAVADGPALRSDLAIANDRVRRRAATTGAARPDALPELRGVTVAVPRVQRYPATFLAYLTRSVVDDDGRPASGVAHDVAVFVKRTPSQPWRRTLQVSVPAAPPALRVTGGWADAPPAGPGARVKEVAATVRAEMNAGIARGRLRPGAPLVDASEVADQVTYYSELLAEDSRVGLRATTSVTAATPTVPTGPAYAATDGSAVTVLALPLRRAVTGDSVCLLQSADQHQWGTALRPGRYRAVTAEYTLTAVVSVPASGPPKVVGMATPTLRVTGRRC